MNTLKRHLTHFVKEDIEEKMVLIGGPRQVGKTTLAFALLDNGNKQHPAYLNWDIPKDRTAIRQRDFPAKQKIIVLDEIHKYARWRNYLKGLYDEFVPEVSFLITGSARLEHYHRGGDSLHGRYHGYRLHPFSAVELNSSPTQSDTELLLKFGGFPEPLVKQSERFHQRWRRERVSRVIAEDIRSLERVQELSLLELLIDALPDRVGSPISLNAVAFELEVTAQTVERWVKILENIYLCFRIIPYGESRIKSVRKEKKLYFWDWSQVPNSGARFENMMACQLLKYCHFIEDTQGYKMELRYLRDTAGREVDFVVLKDKKPLFAVEVKSSAREINPNISYFLNRTKIPIFYQVHLQNDDRLISGSKVRSIPYWLFCKELGMP